MHVKTKSVIINNTCVNQLLSTNSNGSKASNNNDDTVSGISTWQIVSLPLPVMKLNLLLHIEQYVFADILTYSSTQSR